MEGARVLVAQQERHLGHGQLAVAQEGQRLVVGLLSRRLTPQDVPTLRQALSEQQALLEVTIRLLGRQSEDLAALREQVEALRRIVDGADDPAPWEDPDDREW